MGRALVIAEGCGDCVGDHDEPLGSLQGTIYVLYILKFFPASRSPLPHFPPTFPNPTCPDPTPGEVGRHLVPLAVLRRAGGGCGPIHGREGGGGERVLRAAGGEREDRLSRTPAQAGELRVTHNCILFDVIE